MEKKTKRVINKKNNAFDFVSSLNEYQNRTLDTWTGENREVRAIIGLAEEAGEVLGKYKKYLRGDYDIKELKLKIMPELGDTLFYIAVICQELQLNFGLIAFENLEKLASRKKRGKLNGSGDYR